MKLGGFSGKVLFVDLSRRKIWRETLDPKLAAEFIGGFGICAKMACDLANSDVFDPRNPVIIGTGPLVGTNVPAASRLYAFTRLPANGAVGWGGGGGVTFACNLKFAGYDAAVITGRAEKPSIIKIEDDDVEICDAGDLWGLGINRTCEEIWKEYGEGGIIAIGQAGENLVRFSMAFVDRLSTIGRGGIGAVMGSKNLKAVFVRGTGEVEIADRKRYEELCSQLLDAIRSYPYTKEWQELGLLKSLPLVPKDVYLQIRKKRVACVSCPVGDKDVIDVGGEVYSTSALNLLTPVVMGMGDYRKAVKLTAALDDYGLDMFEFYGLLEFARELDRQGKLELDEEVDFTSLNSMLHWARMITFRQGAGNLLARGFAELEMRSGVKAKSVVKGMRAYVTPRGPLVWNLFGTMELGQIVDPRGPHVAAGGSPTYFAKRPVESFRKHLRRMGLDDAKIDEILSDGIRIGKLLCYSHIWFTILASLGICARAQINRFYSAELCAELYSAVTGINVSRKELMMRAKGVWRMLKLANLKTAEDIPPEDWFEDGFRDYVTGKPLSREDVERMIEEYYEEMGLSFGR